MGGIGGGQLAEPQTMPAIQTVQSSADEFSPVLSNKSQRKYTFDSRSPSGQSPVTKSRKTPQTPNAASGSQRDGSDKETGSPKSKTWKGIVARQFRRIGGAHNQETLPPEGISFGVPLHMCPPVSFPRLSLIFEWNDIDYLLTESRKPVRPDDPCTLH